MLIGANACGPGRLGYFRPEGQGALVNGKDIGKARMLASMPACLLSVLGQHVHAGGGA